MRLNLLRPLCFFGLHRASQANLARSVSDQITVCTRCGIKLIKKRRSRRWRVVEERRRVPR